VDRKSVGHAGVVDTLKEIRVSVAQTWTTLTAGTWRGEPDELWSPGASGVLGRRPLAPGGARCRDRWVVAQWRLAARQDTDNSGGCRWGLPMGRKGTQPSRV
jgi:hypothetical protein